EDAGPLAHPVRPDRFIEINNFYTATVYEKGAELCRMIHTMLGETLFRKGMDLYFERHDGEAATVEDFVTCFADASGRDLTQFMTWYAQAGTPGLVCDLSYNASRREAQLTVEQVLTPTPGQATKKPLQIPLSLGLLGGNGNDLPLELADGRRVENGVLEVTRRKEAFRFVDIPQKPVPSLLRDFSAPVNLTVDLDDGEMAFLMANDADEFNRWQTGQDYAMRLLIGAVRAATSTGSKAPDPKPFIQALVTIASDDRLEPAMRAQTLAIPSESDVARVIATNIDPDAIHKARKALRKRIARDLGPTLETLYRQMAVKGKYEPSRQQIGQRTLRNTALALLAVRGTADDVQRAVKHFQSARNLTDENAALAVLADIRGPERTAAFERFYERWKDDHIVIDSWFAYQAMSSLPGTLGTVKKLLKHPLMSLQNPNKARTLIGAFAANPTAFNKSDGSGYTFVAGMCLEIDRFNPQLAARMLTTFRSWRTLEPGRRKLAEKALSAIARDKKLSRDAFEIVTKMLDG
ncbi:MAG: DUF3458 domain-containing protein, partial [Hyphomicrobiaceae bacterium]